MVNKETHAQMVYSLWKAGKQSFERADATQAQLSRTAEEFRHTTLRLPAEIARSLESKLPRAAQEAAEMIASKWTDANVHADRAAAAYQTATQQARRAIYGGAAILLGVFAAVLLIVGLWILPKFDEVAALRVEKANLEEKINLLTKNGARANLVRCSDSQRERLCVWIDDTVKFQDKRLKVISGY